MAREFYHEITPVNDWQPNEPNSIGGMPWLPVSMHWPICKRCDERLSLLLQFTVRGDFDLPVRTGSHFLVFSCARCADIGGFFDQSLPRDFWNLGGGHYQFILARPEDEKRFMEQEAFVKPRRIEFVRKTETIERLEYGDISYDVGDDCAKIGGVPRWAQHPEPYICACGSPMEYFGMLSENFEFPSVTGAPIQDHGANSDHYLLFLGNLNYFMVCSTQCSPFAVLTVMQN